MKVEEHLRRLSVGCRYKGYAAIAEIGKMVMEDESRMDDIRRYLLQQYADMKRCSISSVVRNIETIAQRAWLGNPEYLIRLAGYPLTKRPTAYTFIEILLTAALRERT